MKFGPRETIFVALLMLIPVGAWWFVFRPQNVHNAEMRRQIEARQAKLRELNKVMGTIGDLEKQIDSLQQAVDFFQSKLPDEKEIDKILKEIWRLAESNNLQAKSIRMLVWRESTSLLPEASSQAEQPIAIQLSGDFRGFYSFLLALESQPRIMRIRKMDLKLFDKDTPGAVSAEFEMSIFFERNRRKTIWPQKT